MLPKEITWEDGERYKIDRVTDIRQAVAMKAGGQGDRYTVMIGGHQSYLFFERSTNLTGNNIGRWFVERKTVKKNEAPPGLYRAGGFFFFTAIRLHHSPI